MIDLTRLNFFYVSSTPNSSCVLFYLASFNSFISAFQVKRVNVDNLQSEEKHSHRDIRL